MRLSELTQGALTGDVGGVEIRGLTADSNAVEPGFLFAAMPGTTRDGLDFADDAIARGAVAVLSRPDPRLAGLAVPVIEDAAPRRRFALLAARFYGAQPTLVVAVTGTNGKSSVAEFTRQIWTGTGRRAASLGTLGIRIDADWTPVAHTTPEPASLHNSLKALAEDGVDHLALEASSHGLDQNRLDGVDIAAAAFTSFSRDHLDYHATAEDYLAAKLRLFTEVMPHGRVAVVNTGLDDLEDVVAACRNSGHRIVTYGEGDGDFCVRRRHSLPDGQRLELELFGIRSEIELPLVGDFQAMNALCALALTVVTGTDSDDAVAALRALQTVPGRLEHVARHPNGAAVYVDYSHTPDGLRHALNALRAHTTGRLVVAFGCGGDRDPGKRPLMGRAAAELADCVIVTDDNPRTEDAAAIRAQAMAACPDATEIGDRESAIRAGLDMLREGDLLLVAGKGHESGQDVGGVVRPFNDADVCRTAVADIGGTP